jgi:hypothetical protein
MNQFTDVIIEEESFLRQIAWKVQLNTVMVDFATAASQNGVYITQQMCHISRLLSYDKDISNSKSNVFCCFWD